MKVSAFRLAVIVIALVAMARPAAADPVALTVTSGNLTLNANSTSSLFTFVTDNGVTITGQWPFGFPRPNPPGQLNLGSTFAYDVVPFVGGDPFVHANITTPEGSFSGYLSGRLLFTSNSVPFPDFQTTPQPQLFSVWAPFTMNGNVSFFDRLEQGPMDLLPLFSLGLTGSGTARMDLIGATGPNGPVFTFLRTSYDFGTSATPEPASLVLLSTGLIGAWRLGRKGEPQAR